MVDTVVLTNVGKALAGNLVGGLNTTDYVQYVGYTNETTAPDVADTSANWFHAGAESGPRVIIQSASYDTGTNVLTLVFFFGAGQGNENSGAINKVGFFTASTGGTLFIECKFGTTITKTAGKELQVTLNLTVQQG